jgi:hypothetical protein
MSSANVDLVRSLFADWERGDFSVRASGRTPRSSSFKPTGPEPGRATGLAEMATTWRTRLNVIADVRVEAEKYRELDDTRTCSYWFGPGGSQDQRHRPPADRR